jgi:hypothetical protein
MKTVIKSIVVTAALLLSISMFAQVPVQFGVKAGLNLSNITDGTAKVGFNAGVTLDYNFTPNVALLTGLEYSLKGAKSDGEDADVKLNLSYIQLPIHIGYKLPVAEGTNVVFHAGPYLAYAASGSWKVGSLSLDAFGDEATEVAKLKRFDFGLGLGAGLEFGKIGVGLGWDFGLANIADTSDGSMKNQNAYLTVGYKF